MTDKLFYIGVETYQHHPDYLYLLKRDRKNHIWAEKNDNFTYNIFYYNGHIMKCLKFNIYHGEEYCFEKEIEIFISNLSDEILEKFYRFSLLISSKNTLSMTLKKLNIPIPIQNIIYQNGTLIKEAMPLYHFVSEKRILPMYIKMHRQKIITTI